MNPLILRASANYQHRIRAEYDDRPRCVVSGCTKPTDRVVCFEHAPDSVDPRDVSCFER